MSGLVDYAGLFPPAALGMEAAVREYQEHLASPGRWMLGRFIVPAARLDEFEKAAAPHLASSSEPWRLSLLAGADVRASMHQAIAYNNQASRHPGVQASSHPATQPSIDTVEFKSPGRSHLDAVLQAIPAGFTSYVEFPLDAELEAHVALLARRGARAKIRTGGVTANAFPPAGEVVRFIQACVDHGVPFKATAGLHHPLRGDYRLTYEPGSGKGAMFGFINVFLAAAFARVGMTGPNLVELLEEPSPAAFNWRADGVSWRGHTLSIGDLEQMRARTGMGFGSCSFREPWDDLHQVGWL